MIPRSELPPSGAGSPTRETGIFVRFYAFHSRYQACSESGMAAVVLVWLMSRWTKLYMTCWPCVQGEVCYACPAGGVFVADEPDGFCAILPSFSTAFLSVNDKCRYYSIQVSRMASDRGRSVMAFSKSRTVSARSAKLEGTRSTCVQDEETPPEWGFVPFAGADVSAADRRSPHWKCVAGSIIEGEPACPPRFPAG